jgi:hypothetical protein
MGTLIPGATYIYERADGVVYARELGADPNTRQVIGMDYDPRTNDVGTLHDQLREDKMWGEIRRAAQTNPTLQDALNRAIIIYQLSKANQ